MKLQNQAISETSPLNLDILSPGDPGKESDPGLSITPRNKFVRSKASTLSTKINSLRAENIPIIDLYFNKGDGKRYRSLGCFPCTNPVDSESKNVKEIIEELKSGKFANIAERSGRAQDKEDGGLETLRRDGYMQEFLK